MNLFLRLLYVLLCAVLKRKNLGFLEKSILKLCVFPNDLDIYGHMNNGRYQTLMDLGRIDWIIRVGLGVPAKQFGWKPLVATVKMQYKKSLHLFESFEIHTRIICWDEKWFFVEQIFTKEGEVAAMGIVKGLFRGPQGNVPTEKVLKSLGLQTVSPKNTLEAGF